ncbi:MAG: hypothetical protein R3C16_02060 [Hyphomonadaceae bacterium]
MHAPADRIARRTASAPHSAQAKSAPTAPRTPAPQLKAATPPADRIAVRT